LLGDVYDALTSVWNILKGMKLATDILWNTTIGFETMLGGAPLFLPIEFLTMILAVRVFIYSWFFIDLLMGRPGIGE
jgi:hypothetical protein